MPYIEDKLVEAVEYYHHAIPSERSRALDHTFYKRAFLPLFNQCVESIAQFYKARKIARLYGRNPDLHADNIHNYTVVLGHLGRLLRMKPVDVFWTVALAIEIAERSVTAEPKLLKT